jgi:GNAT superfamily N-acetyltransferase
MTVTVRRAVAEDARTIAQFAIKLILQHQNYDPRRFSRLSSIEGAEWFYGSRTKIKDEAVLVAELEGKIVGFAYIEYEAKNYAEMLENAAWLHDIYVDETARGSRAGKLLIEESIKIAKELGAEKLMLTAAQHNEFARNFFEHNGFRTTMVEMMLDLTESQDND